MVFPIYAHILLILLSLQQNLEEKEKKHTTTKDQLLREQKYLRERLDQLQDATNFLPHPIHKRRSISECSSGVSSSSSNSEPETSETNDPFDSPAIDNGMQVYLKLQSFILNVMCLCLAARLLHSFANFKMQIEQDNSWPMVDRETISNSF